jgi:transposase
VVLGHPGRRGPGRDPETDGRDHRGRVPAAADPVALAAQVHRYRSAAQLGITATAARSTKLMKSHNALARRLLNRQGDYLRFTTDSQIPPDNNGSERDIRMIKPAESLRLPPHLTGAQHFCTIRSYLSTAAKHGIGFHGALVQLTQGRPWLPSAA